MLAASTNLSTVLCLASVISAAPVDTANTPALIRTRGREVIGSRVKVDSSRCTPAFADATYNIVASLNTSFVWQSAPSSRNESTPVELGTSQFDEVTATGKQFHIESKDNNSVWQIHSAFDIRYCLSASPDSSLGLRNCTTAEPSSLDFKISCLSCTDTPSFPGGQGQSCTIRSLATGSETKQRAAAELPLTLGERLVLKKGGRKGGVDGKWNLQLA